MTMPNKITYEKYADFIEILPQLIHDNDAVLGAIVKALSDVMPTREDTNRIIREMDKRFENLTSEVHERFEKVDQRFEDLISEMHIGFERSDKRMERNQKKMDLQFLEMKANIMRMETKTGGDFEEVVLQLMKETLKLEDIDPDKLQRQELKDPDGAIAHVGYKSDIDVLAKNGHTYIVEVKSKANYEAITQILRNAKLFEHNYSIAPTGLIIVALKITQYALEIAKSENIRVVYGDIIQ